VNLKSTNCETIGEDESAFSHVKKGENIPSFLIMPYLWAFFKRSQKSDHFISEVKPFHCQKSE